MFPQMIEFAEKIADRHCYELESGLYFDVSTVADYGRLARAHTDEGEGRIEAVEGKRNAADFAIWRKTPAGETRQMEWDSPWGRGAPGWHLECSVMSGALLGFPLTFTPAASTIARSTTPTRSPRTRRSAAQADWTRLPIRAPSCGCTTTSSSSAAAR
jgi:hypothetical protein